MALALMAAAGQAAASDLASRIDSLFEARYASPKGVASPGGAVIIADRDSIIYERYFGTADLGTGEPVTNNTLFNIASVSKQFTVVALMQQLGSGLDVPVSRYMDYQQKFWGEVTLAHLASHTSGIPDSRDRSDRSKCIFATDSSSIAYFPSVDSLKFAPGTAYDYLNPSFLILAKVVEQKSGEEFCDYVSRHIFGPAGMASAVYFSPEGMPVHTAHAYAPGDDGRWHEYDYGEETFFATRPDGGIYATARDMLAWETALADGVVLPPEVLACAYAPRISVTDSPWCDYQRYPHTSYGLGWFVDTTPGRPVKVYHTGDNGGFQAYVAKYPATGLRIIVLENRHDRSRRSMAEALDSILF